MHVGRLQTATHANSKNEPSSLLASAVFTTWLWKTESNQRRPKHPDDRRILNQCKSPLVGNAARGCRMTNRPKPSARPKKMRANGAPQSRIPHDKHSRKTQNPGVHRCSIRPQERHHDGILQRSMVCGASQPDAVEQLSHPGLLQQHTRISPLLLP